MKGYKNDGFTLVEMLIALAVTVILLAIGIVGVVQYQSHMKITELDNMAREIYMAAQNRAVLLQNSGRLESQFEGVGTLALASSGGASP